MVKLTNTRGCPRVKKRLLTSFLSCTLCSPHNITKVEVQYWRHYPFPADIRRELWKKLYLCHCAIPFLPLTCYHCSSLPGKVVEYFTTHIPNILSVPEFSSCNKIFQVDHSCLSVSLLCFDFLWEQKNQLCRGNGCLTESPPEETHFGAGSFLNLKWSFFTFELRS